uniref:PPM-type phosphatase domain-containing protein n=1 Tax=Arcella intermedia TaxID=1963864 RepID=A0A6B2L221_9EUKA
MGMYCETEVTYPKRSLGSMVLCDAFRAARVGNRITTVICDGCSWGPRSHEASQKASKTFCDYMSSETLHEKTDTSDALMVHLQNALFAAHKSIAHDKAGNNVFQAGTTTLCGGVLAKLDSEVDEWAFVCISVGDSKAFHWSAANRKVKDITWGNRFDARDPSDCGGRIGPYSPQGEPDLRNLRFYFAACNKDDLIMVVTDGIYDNLDPEHLGMDPRSVSKEYDYDSWDDMPNILVKQAKEDYVVAQIEKFIESSETKSPQEITKKLILNSFMVTERSRTYMENHPNEAEPKSYKAFPGKMDHVTCITIKIKSLEEVEVDADEQLKNLRQRLSHPKQKRIGSGIFKKTLYRSPNKKKEELEGMEFKNLSPSAPIHKKFIEYLRKRLAFEQYQLYEDILDFETCECDGKEMEEKAKLLFEKCTIYAGNPSLIQELKDRIGKSNFSLEMFLPIKTETLQILESMFLEFKISKSKK